MPTAARGRARATSPALEKAVDRGIAIEMEYARAVRSAGDSGTVSRAMLAEVDAARERASSLLVAWSHNVGLEQHAVVAQDALADLMEKAIAMARARKSIDGHGRTPAARPK